MKVLFGLALRTTTSSIESLLRLVGLDRTAPGCGTISLIQKTLAVNIRYRVTKSPLNLLIPYRDITN